MASAEHSIVLYQFAKGKLMPSNGPFVMKLETYLKMNDIPFKNDFSTTFSKKGKIPWIKFNGQEVSDSQICMQFLNEKLGKNLDAHLTPEQQATSRAYQRMVDEHLYWGFVNETAFYLPTNFLIEQTGFNRLIIYLFRRRIKGYCLAQGMGRHSREESLKMIKEDLKALSDFLGSKPYFFGDEPTLLDCSVFGIVSPFYYYFGDQAPFKKILEEEFPNLVRYCERVKEHYWKDWEERLQQQKK